MKKHPCDHIQADTLMIEIDEHFVAIGMRGTQIIVCLDGDEFELPPTYDTWMSFSDGANGWCREAFEELAEGLVRALPR